MDLLKESENVIIFHVKKAGLNLEKFLLEEGLSSRFFRRIYRNKTVYVNGKFKRKSTLLNRGDLVSILIEDEVDDTLEENIPLDIIYEDMDILAINKPPFIVVHPTKSHQSNTISNGVAHYFKKKRLKRKVRLVNRLDMNTSGILLIAKSSFAHQQTALQFEEKKVEKKYMALVDGIVEKDFDTINLPIAREDEGSIRKKVCPQGKASITKYKVIERFKNSSLLDIELVTGRSHQIRVHLSHIGHPIIGDTLYFEPSPYIHRQALHSYYLRLRQPRNHKELTLETKLPEDMERIIYYLNKF